MKRPTYYLWKNDYSSEEEYNTTKDKYRNLGFRVVTYQDGQSDKDIHVGLMAVIKNHYSPEHIPQNVIIQARKEVTI